MDVSNIIRQANSLLNELLSTYDETYHHGTQVSGIYDTAWISMIQKKPRTSELPEWAYPMCFDFLCRSQAEDGGWGHPASLVDRISCTFVSLLAIKKHIRLSGNLSMKTWLSLQDRATRAMNYIHLNIESWNLDSLDTRLPIGFELWFPVLIEKLEEEGVVFKIPGKDRIIEFRREKLSRFPLEVFYSPSGLIQPSTLFTLEGFIGILDFSKISHQLRYGSMFSSPSSTAVYLMEAPEWDLAADAYLQNVVAQSITKNSRCVPQMFPTSIWDIDWVLNLFADGGLGINKLDTNAVKRLGQMTLQCLKEQGGVAGSDQHVCPDPDSTAMAYKAVYYSLGIYKPIQPMIDAFEGETNYFTFRGERDPSISSNAHVLQALLLSPEGGKHISSIEKCIKYLCETWYNTHGLIEDKWSNSEYYATWTITQGLTDYLVALNEERIEAVSENLLKVKIPLSIFQVVIQTLLRQNVNGSWGSACTREDTSHAIMILKTTWSLPFISVTLRQVIGQAVQRGQAYVLANLDEPFNDYSWNGKCLYGQSSISRAAALSALSDSQPARIYSQKVKALYQFDSDIIDEHSKLLRKLPYFADVPPWIVEASCFEASFFVRDMTEATRLEKKKNIDKGFLSKLAAVCTSLNYVTKAFLANHILIGMLNFMEFVWLIDTLVDSELNDRSPENMQLIEKLLDQIFDLDDPCLIPQPNSNAEPITLQVCRGQEDIYSIAKAMEYGKKQFMKTPRVLAATQYDRKNLLVEFRIGLLAQVSKSSMAIAPGPGHPSGSNFHDWVQGVGSYDHLGRVGMKLMICLIQCPSEVVCVSPVERYLLEELNRHLGIWGRLWKDYADIERDRADSNVNVLDFAEFQYSVGDVREDPPNGMMKRYLSQIIKYEEDLVDETLKKYANAVASRANQSINQSKFN